MILCTNGLKKETLKLQFHTRSPVNSNDHAVFFPGKPRLLRDLIKRKSEIKVLFCRCFFLFCFLNLRWTGIWNSNFPTTPQLLLLPPQQNTLPPLPPKSHAKQHRTGWEQQQHLFHSISVILPRAGTAQTHLLLSKAPWRLWIFPE